MEVVPEESAFYMCTVCAVVFISKDDAEQHICPSQPISQPQIEVDEQTLSIAVQPAEEQEIEQIPSVDSTPVVASNTTEHEQESHSLYTKPAVIGSTSKEKGKKILVNAFTQNVDEDKIDSRTGWTVEATNSLIKVYKETKAGKGRTLWNSVAEKMQELGYKVTSHQCDQRFGVIKGRYYRVTEGLAKGRASTKMTSFPYLLALSDVLPVRKQSTANEGSDDEEWCKLPKRKAKWSKEEENTFLSILKAKMMEQASAQVKKPMQEVWGEISQELGYRNFSFTAISCEQKWLSLVKQYKRIESGIFQEDTFDNYYIVMEIYQWFPQDYLSKTSFFSKPSSTGEVKGTGSNLTPCVWTEEATAEFLTLMNQRKETFHMYKKKSIWIEISKCMKEKGYTYTASNIECKWKSMKSKYRKDLSTVVQGAIVNTPFFKEVSDLMESIEKSHAEELYDENSRQKGYTEGDSELEESTRKYKPRDNPTSRVENVEISRQKQQKHVPKFASKNLDLAQTNNHNLGAGDDKIPAGWSPHACECLLKLILERKELFGSERILKGLWEEISGILKEWGFDYDAVQCGSKWKTMKRSFLKVEENNAKPGAPKKIIPFYDQIKELNSLRESAEFEWNSSGRHGYEKEKKKPAPEMQLGDFSDSGDESVEEDGTVGDLSPKASNWTHEAIIHLINNYKEVFLKVKKGIYNSKMFWKTVHHRMKKIGYNMNVTSCRRKMHKLRAMFVRKTRKTLENFDEFSDTTWPYYHAMRSLLIMRKQYDNKDPLPNANSYGFDEHLNSDNIDFELSKRKNLVVWDKDATTLLMEMYKDRKHKFDNCLEYRKKDLWQEIATDLAKAGFNYNGNSCDMKFKSLLRTYRQTVDHNSVPGNTKKLCPFYSDFKELVPYTPLDSKAQKQIFKSLKQKSKEIITEKKYGPEQIKNENENETEQSSVLSLEDISGVPDSESNVIYSGTPYSSGKRSDASKNAGNSVSKSRISETSATGQGCESPDGNASDIEHFFLNMEDDDDVDYALSDEDEKPFLEAPKTVSSSRTPISVNIVFKPNPSDSTSVTSTSCSPPPAKRQKISPRQLPSKTSWTFTDATEEFSNSSEDLSFEDDDDEDENEEIVDDSSLPSHDTPVVSQEVSVTSAEILSSTQDSSSVGQEFAVSVHEVPFPSELSSVKGSEISESPLPSQEMSAPSESAPSIDEKKHHSTTAKETKTVISEKNSKDVCLASGDSATSNQNNTSENEQVGSMMSWLENYEQRQERREQKIVDRMEKMQKDTMDLMKTLATLMASSDKKDS